MINKNLTKKEIKDIEKTFGVKVKKEGSFSKKIVSLILILNVLFTLAILYVFLKTGSEPMALVGAFFGFTGIELWSLSKIKRVEIKEEGNDD
jgi:uncharacterized membrane protein